MLVFDIFTLTDKILEEMNIKEITSSKIFIREGEPDPEGLASYDVFGYPGSEERKKTFGYIRLNDTFIHPHVLFELKSIKGIYLDLIMGNGEFCLFEGDIYRTTDAAVMGKNVGKTGNGAKFLMSIWDGINFEYKHLKSGPRYNRLRFLGSLKKSHIFIDKILVMPPYYRDVDLGGNKKNEFNEIYIKIINLASSMKTNVGMMGVFEDVSDSYKKISTILSEFYESVIKMYGGRKGFIHEYVIGKPVDFSARLVISCMDVSEVETADDMRVDFTKSLLPLFAAIKCFAPFIYNGVRSIITDYLGGSEYVYRVIDTKTKKTSHVFETHLKNAISNEEFSMESDSIRFERLKLANDWQNVLTTDYIYNLIDLYSDSIEHRLDIFTLPLEDGGSIPMNYYVNEFINQDMTEDLSTIYDRLRPLSLIELFYMAAYNTIRDKHIFVTRYPIEDHNNTYPSKMNIIPYKRCTKLIVGDTEYPNFPLINYETDREIIHTMFTDSLTLFPIYLSALGGDFDGDMVSVIGLFTEEGNMDAHNHIYSVANIAAIDGTSAREMGALMDHIINAFTYKYFLKGIV